MTQLLLTLPTQGQKNITIAPEQALKLDFPVSEANFDRVDNALRISSPDKGELIIQDFFVTSDDAKLPLFLLEDGTTVAAADFLQAMYPNMDIATAMGPSIAPSSGVNAYGDGAGELIGGVSSLDGLSGLAGWNGALAQGLSTTPIAGLSAPATPVDPTNPEKPDARFIQTQKVIQLGQEDTIDIAGQSVTGTESLHHKGDLHIHGTGKADGYDNEAGSDHSEVRVGDNVVHITGVDVQGQGSELTVGSDYNLHIEAQYQGLSLGTEDEAESLKVLDYRIDEDTIVYGLKGGEGTTTNLKGENITIAGEAEYEAVIANATEETGNGINFQTGEANDVHIAGAFVDSSDVSLNAKATGDLSLSGRLATDLTHKGDSALIEKDMAYFTVSGLVLGDEDFHHSSSSSSEKKPLPVSVALDAGGSINIQAELDAVSTTVSGQKGQQSSFYEMGTIAGIHSLAQGSNLTITAAENVSLGARLHDTINMAFTPDASQLHVEGNIDSGRRSYEPIKLVVSGYREDGKGNITTIAAGKDMTISADCDMNKNMYLSNAEISSNGIGFDLKITENSVNDVSGLSLAKGNTTTLKAGGVMDISSNNALSLSFKGSPPTINDDASGHSAQGLPQKLDASLNDRSLVQGASVHGAALDIHAEQGITLNAKGKAEISVELDSTKSTTYIDNSSTVTGVAVKGEGAAVGKLNMTSNSDIAIAAQSESTISSLAHSVNATNTIDDYSTLSGLSVGSDNYDNTKAKAEIRSTTGDVRVDASTTSLIEAKGHDVRNTLVRYGKTEGMAVKPGGELVVEAGGDIVAHAQASQKLNSQSTGSHSNDMSLSAEVAGLSVNSEWGGIKGFAQLNADNNLSLQASLSQKLTTATQSEAGNGNFNNTANLSGWVKGLGLSDGSEAHLRSGQHMNIGAKTTVDVTNHNTNTSSTSIGISYAEAFGISSSDSDLTAVSGGDLTVNGALSINYEGTGAGSLDVGSNANVYGLSAMGSERSTSLSAGRNLVISAEKSTNIQQNGANAGKGDHSKVNLVDSGSTLGVFVEDFGQSKVSLEAQQDLTISAKNSTTLGLISDATSEFVYTQESNGGYAPHNVGGLVVEGQVSPNDIAKEDAIFVAAARNGNLRIEASNALTTRLESGANSFDQRITVDNTVIGASIHNSVASLEAGKDIIIGASSNTATEVTNNGTEGSLLGSYTHTHIGSTVTGVTVSADSQNKAALYMEAGGNIDIQASLKYQETLTHAGSESDLENSYFSSTVNSDVTGLEAENALLDISAGKNITIAASLWAEGKTNHEKDSSLNGQTTLTGMAVSSNSTLSFDAGESIAISAKAGGSAMAQFNRDGIQADARGLFIEGGNNHVQLTAQQDISVIAQTSGEGNLQGISMQSDNSSLDFSALNGDIIISATGDSANGAEALMLGGNNSEASFTGNNIFIDALAGNDGYSSAFGLEVHSGMQSTFTVKDTFKLTADADDAWGIVVSSGSSNTILGGDSGVTVIISCAKYGVKDDAASSVYQVAIDVADGGKHLIQTGSGNDHIVIQGDMAGKGENTIDAGAGNDIIFLHGSIEGSNVTINGGEGQDVLILKAESWEHFTHQYENLFSNGTITGIESIQYIVGEKGGDIPEWLEQFCSGGIALSEYKDGALDGFSLDLFGISPTSDELDSLLSLSRAMDTDEPESGLFASIQHANAPYEAIPSGGYGTPVDSLMGFGQEEEALLQQMLILKNFAS